MLGGIIAGALGGAGKAASSIADMTMQEQARSRLAQEQALIEEQKMRLADQLARDRASWEVDPKGLGGKKLELAKLTGAAETEELASRERTLAPIKTENEVDRTRRVKTAEGEVDRTNAAAFATPEGRRALEGIRAKAAAGESSATRAAAAESAERAAAARRLNKLYADLDKETDPAKREGIIDRIQAERAPGRATGGGSGRPGSFSDIVALTRVLDSQAKEAELQGKPEEAAELRQQIRDLTRDVTKAKGLPSGSTPAATDSSAPQQSDIDYLKANPGKAAAFDARFGAGSANKVLGPAPARPSKAAPQERSKPEPKPEPPDSPSAKFKERQAKIKADKEAWNAGQKDAANRLFMETDLKNPESAQRLQDDPLFGYLTPQQKAQVQRAVFGR